MQEPIPDSLMVLAQRLADVGGAAVREYFRTAVAVDEKADSSPVTVADREAEQRIRDVLTAERPQDGIFGEEFGVERGDAELVWVIDPIDGTRSFITGRPTFATLIALLQNGEPVLGVIDQPVIGDRWVGARGHETRFNGAPARTRPCGDLALSTLSCTSPELFEGADADAFARLRAGVQRTTYGGDGHAYGLLASGFIDLIAEASLALYDFAALVPVIAGAGGMVTDWQGRPLGRASDGRVLAAGDHRIHQAALAHLGQAPAPAPG